MLTLKHLKQAMRETDRPGERFVEIYPLAYKNNKKLNEFCEARIRAGLGMWDVPLKNKIIK